MDCFGTKNDFSTSRDKWKRTLASVTIGEPHLGGARLHQVRPLLLLLLLLLCKKKGFNTFNSAGWLHPTKFNSKTPLKNGGNGRRSGFLLGFGNFSGAIYGCFQKYGYPQTILFGGFPLIFGNIHMFNLGVVMFLSTLSANFWCCFFEHSVSRTFLLRHEKKMQSFGNTQKIPKKAPNHHCWGFLAIPDPMFFLAHQAKPTSILKNSKGAAFWSWQIDALLPLPEFNFRSKLLDGQALWRHLQRPVFNVEVRILDSLQDLVKSVTFL